MSSCFECVGVWGCFEYVGVFGGGNNILIVTGLVEWA